LEKEMIDEISVFFPAYNEEKNITSTVIKAQTKLNSIAKKYEIIVVNDGSSDQTDAKVKALIKKNNRIRLISHSPNQGYGAALKTGISQCKYNLICYTDSDGQFKFSEITKFIKKINQGADMVVGYRVNRTDTPYRRLMAKVLHLVGLALFKINVKDVDCGFKVFKKKVTDSIGPLKTASAITETELVTRTKRASFKIDQVPVAHHSRTGGEQTGGRPQVIIKAAREGLQLWYLLNQEK